MSLLVDPEYFLHTLRLNYLRKLPDPTGPSSISFSLQKPPSSPQPPPRTSNSLDNQFADHRNPTPYCAQAETQNPYIHLSGLSDPERWPELLVRGSPPEPFSLPVGNSTDHTPIRTRRRRADGAQPPHPSHTALRYSETIVGPRASGLAAGIRVSGRKSFRASRLPSNLIPDPKNFTSTPPSQPPNVPQSQSDQTAFNVHASNFGVNALALTEGRTNLIPGLGLNPEDSDDDPNPLSLAPLHLTRDQSNDRKPISRNPTTTTIKSRRRRISAVTFANSSLSFASPAGSILNLSLSRHRTRAQRGHSISSIATTNTVISSDFSEYANQTQVQTFDSPTASLAPVGADLTAHQDLKSASNHPIDPINQPSPDLESNSHVFYSTEHDPDKRLSDMLYTFRPFESKRSTQIVGRVELEPAPLLEADNEDETGDEDIETDQTDTGTEQGEDDSSYNLEETAQDTSTLDESINVMSQRIRLKRQVGSTGTNSIESGFVEETPHSKSISNASVTSTMDTNSLSRVIKPSNHLLPSHLGFERNGPGGQSPPIIRRRERRRVNIKMGRLLGPPIIEEDSVASLPDSDPQPSKAIPPPITLSSKPTRVFSCVSRSSLPDLRRALKTSGFVNPQRSANPEMYQFSQPVNNLSPGRARALTTPTPIPSIAIESYIPNENTSQKISHKRSQGLEPVTSFKNGPGSSLAASKSTTSHQSHNFPVQSRAQHSHKIMPISQQPSLNPADEPKTGLAVTKTSSKTKRPQLTFAKIDIEDLKLRKPVVLKSTLTQRLNAQSSSSSSDNPFRCLYALLASKERNALKLTLYFPFSQESRKPLKTSMKSDVCVEEVVGFALWNYVEESREPKLTEIKNIPTGLDLNETSSWCLRLVEDDGEVDEDFPALERTRPAAKVGSNEFAIVMATAAQAQQNQSAQSQIQRRPSRVLGEPKRALRAGVEPAGVTSLGTTSLMPPLLNAIPGNSGSIFDGPRPIGGGLSGSLISGGYGSTPLGASSFSVPPVYLKIRIPSPGKGVDSIITTLNVTIDMYLADVLETLVKKKSLGHVKDWALLVPSSPSIPIHQRDIVVPLDRTVQSLQGVNSLALVKRTQVSSQLLRNTQLNGNLTSQNTNPSASIFKRLSEIPQPKYVSITDLTSSSKTFLIQTKRRGILGKSDRLLTIEDDYVHISPNHQSMINHTNNINHVNNNNNGDFVGGNGNGKVSSYHISQIVDCTFRPQNGFKLIVLRDSGEKRYDVDAENSQSATEIVRHIKGLKEMYHSTRS